MVMAYVDAQSGRHEEAIDLLDQLLSIPSYASVGVLKIDPWFDPLKDNPRFTALIAKGDVVF